MRRDLVSRFIRRAKRGVSRYVCYLAMPCPNGPGGFILHAEKDTGLIHGDYPFRCSTGSWCTGANVLDSTAALFRAPCKPPKRRTASATIALHCSSLLTSVRRKWASPLAEAMSATVSSPPATFISATSTLAPRGRSVVLMPDQSRQLPNAARRRVGARPGRDERRLRRELASR